MLDQEHLDAFKHALTKNKPDPPDPALKKQIQEFNQDRRTEAFTQFFINQETK